jgi:SAM-dependent methyltransferase
MDSDRLTTQSHWERRGDAIASSVDVRGSCWFREQAAVVDRHIANRGYSTVVEVGAYPGYVLNWFCTEFRLRGTAIEYVPAQARSLARAFPGLEVLEGDFLADDVVEVGRTWDVVFSFGLVEHWSDLRVPLAKHVRMTAPGGTCIVGIPLHDGVYGRIVRGLDPALYERHGRFSVADLRRAFSEVGGCEWSIEVCDAVEGAGFWNCGLGEWVNGRPAATRVMFGKALGAWHRSITRIPVPAALRPNAILVARRS